MASQFSFIDMKPTWKAAERFERIGRFSLHGTPGAVFPLLCPVLEYDWLPGWKCVMRYSQSGVAEKDAVFTTTETHGMTAAWTAITYEPDRFIEYLIVSGRQAIVRLSVTLEEKGKLGTDITWRMLFTPLSRLGRRALRAEWTEDKFNRFIDKRKAELDFFLTNGRIIGS
jgi:hypothetical protein